MRKTNTEVDLSEDEPGKLTTLAQRARIVL